MKQTRFFNWFSLLWIAALLIVIYLYFNWYVDKQYIGIVERKTHLTGSQEPGRIQAVLVKIGDHVEKDQVLTVLDVVDLKSILSSLRNELSQINRYSSSQNSYFALEIETLKLQLDNEVLELMDRLSLIESKSAELYSINSLIQRLENAEKAGLGYNEDLADLIIQRDALAAFLKSQHHIIDSASTKSINRQQYQRLLKTAYTDSITQGLLLDQLSRTEEIRRQIAEVEYRIQQRTITAPCDGFVIDLLAGPGDVVDEFIPILTIEESNLRNLIVYIPKKSTVQPEIGETVRIFSSRNKKSITTGTVSFVHPGFTQADERLSFRGQLFWARKVHVELMAHHRLVPGEDVYVRFEKKHGKHNKTTIAAQNRQNPAEIPDIQDIKIPEKLRLRSRFEPSGVCWLPSMQKFLIVSDDTGLKNSATDHAPWLFYMDESGNVEENPVLISGIREVNDMESITPVFRNIYYILSSQNISRQGKRSVNREHLLKVQANRNGVTVLAKINLLSLLESRLSEDQLKKLGLTTLASDRRPTLNIEGMAFYEGDLYFGLKEPVSDQGAIIWKLTNPEDAFKNNAIEPEQLTVFGTIRLDHTDGRAAGISDMTFDSSGKLWLLSTIPSTDKQNQCGGLHLVNRFKDGCLEATRHLSFRSLKPEGICFCKEGQLLIVFDNDSNTPAFCFINTETL